MFHKLKKILLITIISLIIFVVLVVVFVHQDKETGKISVSFLGRETKVPNNDFMRTVQQEINVADLAQIDWTKAYNKALNDKYQEKTEDNTQRKTNNTSVNNINSQQKKELAYQSFFSYLQRSDVKLDAAQNPLELAIQYRDQGKTEEIVKLIVAFDQKIALVEKITPPEEAVGYHLAKLRLLRDIKSILGDIKDSDLQEPLEEIIGTDRADHLARLSLILKKYLTYFFYPKLRG